MFRKVFLLLIFSILGGSVLLQAQDAIQNGIPVYEKTPPGEFFREWLVCGPFPNPLPSGVTGYRHDSTSLGFYRDYLKDFGGEEKIVPREGMQVRRPDGRIVTWRRVRSYFPEIVLDPIMNPPDSSVAYAVAIVRVPDERDVMAKISSNDGIRAWLNGELILDHNTPGTDTPDRDFVPVHLKAGDNLFLLKISEGFGRWGFTFRLADIEEAQNEILQQLPYLIRPTITKIPEGWSIFAGRKYRVELLPEEKPCTLTVFAPDNHTPEVTIHTLLGSAVFLSKTDPRLTPGGHLATCRIFLEDGRVAEETAWLTDPEPESIQTIWEAFRTVPDADSTYFEGWAHRQIQDCLISQLKTELREGNVPAFRRDRLADVVRRYRNWEARIQTDSCLYDHLFPPIKQIERKSGVPFTWEGAIALKDFSGGSCQADVDRLTETLSGKWGTHLEKMENSVGEKRLILATRKQAANLAMEGIAVPQTFANSEAYQIQISANRIVLVAASDQGLHDGLVTLWQLADRWASLPPAVLSDWAAFPLRTGYIYTRGPLDEKAKAHLLQFVNLKYNQLVLPSFNYYHLDDPEERARVQAYYAFLRKFHMEPVPYVPLPGSDDWNEGVFLQDEPLIVQKGVARMAVKHLLNLPDSHPVLASARAGQENRVVFEEGKDYQIVRTDPPMFRLLPQSGLADGDTIFFTGDIFDPREDRYHKPCPSEPMTYKKHAEAVQDVIQLLHPHTIHIGHDEVGLVTSDSRCLNRGEPGYRLFAEQLNKAYQAIHDIDPTIVVRLWADSVNPYHNAVVRHLEHTADFLTRNLVMDHWFYDVNTPGELDLMHRGTAFFLEKGFRVVVCPWEHLTNHQEWERVLTRYGMYNPNVLGVLHTEWSGKDWGKAATAMIGWCGKTWLTE